MSLRWQRQYGQGRDSSVAVNKNGSSEPAFDKCRKYERELYA
eukprot:CAMPEP_0184334092 /NCGR_PEP_ID=MMETSP1089-20130417/3004_1 /TAXON_ID=38269 ORGANISM="Gloeochaete wittrockiana, Strain SAG46.84" /NCGR_SAMPLE_ID=MMETSP1089 /ASSEMBLY_ACC=CAM_ASM_000445 /LENGTH=41 /DNA_ID= /DNA_START= /DNA_END= /DNA_ORIENTATION=